MIASFNRFEIKMNFKQAQACSHQGSCDSDVSYWTPKIRAKNNKINNNDIRAELKEYGAWSAEELLDEKNNWERIVWIAAGNIVESKNSECSR